MTPLFWSIFLIDPDVAFRRNIPGRENVNCGKWSIYLALV